MCTFLLLIYVNRISNKSNIKDISDKLLLQLVHVTANIEMKQIRIVVSVSINERKQAELIQLR